MLEEKGLTDSTMCNALQREREREGASESWRCLNEYADARHSEQQAASQASVPDLNQDVFTHTDRWV